MAASFPGGVVLGADSRTSTGSYVANRVTNKLTQLAEKVPLPSFASSMLPQARAAKQGAAATTRPGLLRDVLPANIMVSFMEAHAVHAVVVAQESQWTWWVWPQF